MTRSTPAAKIMIIALLVALVALLQFEYDAVTPQAPASGADSGVTPFMVQVMDMGFHPAVASFLWATTMPEILDLLFHGRTEYFTDLSFVNGVDPKLSYPYAFSVLTLTAVPTTTYPYGLQEANKIGLEGLANADPDWRIAYYMATNDFLYGNDPKDAAWYYNIAAETPGVPQYAARFALNFGIETNQRKKTEELWATIASSTNDIATQERADAFIQHLEDFDYLDAAAAQYKKEFGVYPTSTDELVEKGIIPAVPVDPLGFTFIIGADGKSAIDQNALPSYLLSEPTQ